MVIQGPPEAKASTSFLQKKQKTLTRWSVTLRPVALLKRLRHSTAGMPAARAWWHRRGARVRSTRETFFGSFFQKRTFFS
jgi:hypothetical protein